MFVGSLALLRSILSLPLWWKIATGVGLSYLLYLGLLLALRTITLDELREIRKNLRATPEAIR